MNGLILRALDATASPGRHEIPADEPKTDVGRAPECAIVLPSKSVSRVHARFHRRGAELTLEDLGSSNGTAVNGQKLEGSVAVRAGDRIRFGSLEFQLEVPAPAESEGETMMAPPRPADAPLLPSGAATVDGRSPPQTPAVAQTIDGRPKAAATPPHAGAEPAAAAAQREPTSQTVARAPASAAKPAPARPSPVVADSGRPSALELALIALVTYLAVVLAGLAYR